MYRGLGLLWLMAGGLGWVACLGPAHGDLFEYIAREEPKYAWEKTGEHQLPQGTVYELHLVSQVWQEITWEHRVQVFVPKTVEFPQTAALLITGGGGSNEEEQLAMMAANAIGMPFAVLFHIPNQPLFEGKNEDDLIAHSFEKYLETGDATWPLLFPMTKAAVKAMDALQALSQEEWEQPIEGFIVTGASKRGWTTWFTGTVDPRVRAIVPLVYDNLDINAQMRHQIEMWGKYSPQIDDYTRRGLQEKLATEAGQRLATMVDPYTYRDRVTCPKLIVNGTNDPYWTVDALNLYWDDLPGEKLVLYAPNSGHGLDDRVRVLNTMINFARLVAAEKPLPHLTWRHEATDGKLRLTVSSNPRPKAAALWVARAKECDFRPAKWAAVPMKPEGDEFVGEQARPAEGFMALFGEVTYEIDKRQFTLSTQIEVVKADGD